MDPTELAVSKLSSGFNCSQSVLAALAPQLGLEEEAALRVAAAFGGGIARSGDVCGAVTGALMAIGLKYGATDPADSVAKEQAYSLAQELMRRFRERHGDVMCRPLLGLDVGTAEGRQAAMERGLFASICAPLVRDAVEITREILG